MKFEELVYGWFCIIFDRLVEFIIWSSLDDFKNNTKNNS